MAKHLSLEASRPFRGISPLAVAVPCGVHAEAGCPGSGVMGWLADAALGVNSQPGERGKWVGRGRAENVGSGVMDCLADAVLGVSNEAARPQARTSRRVGRQRRALHRDVEDVATTACIINLRSVHASGASFVTPQHRPNPAGFKLWLRLRGRWVRACS